MCIFNPIIDIDATSFISNVYTLSIRLVCTGTLKDKQFSTSYCLFIHLIIILIMNDNVVYWMDILKKETRGTDDSNLRKAEDIHQDYVVITKASVVDKEVHSIPKNLAERYGGHNLWFKVTKEEAENLYNIKE